jgi:hypothetical protein
MSQTQSPLHARTFVPLPGDLYYRHSGQFTAVGLLAAIVGGCVTATVLAIIYAYAVSFSPIIYLNIAMTVFLGIFSGWVVGKALIAGKTRNTSAATLLGLVAGTFAVYVAWVVWLYVFFQRAKDDVPIFAIITEPLAVWQTILAINHHGVWSLGRSSSSPVTGWMLWLVWIAEASIIVGSAVFTARSALSGATFCESCGSWCKSKYIGTFALPTDLVQLHKDLESRNFAALNALGPRAEDVPAWLEVKADTCTGCGRTNALTVETVLLSTDNKGKQSQARTPVVRQLLLSTDELAAIREPAAAPVQPA